MLNDVWNTLAFTFCMKKLMLEEIVAAFYFFLFIIMFIKKETTGINGLYKMKDLNNGKYFA